MKQSQLKTAEKKIPKINVLREQPTAEDALYSVASVFKLSPKVLLVDGRKRNSDPRMMAIALSRLEAGYPLTEITKVFGLKYVSVSQTIIRYKRKLREDNHFRQKVGLIRN